MNDLSETDAGMLLKCIQYLEFLVSLYVKKVSNRLVLSIELRIKIHINVLVFMSYTS